MTQLTITHDDLKRLGGIDPADTSFDAALDAVIAAEQSVYEYALDPAILGASPLDGGLRATLTLGVAERLTGSFLKQQARAAGATDDFHVGPLTITASRTDNLAQLGERLHAQGQTRLEPFARASRRVAYDAAGGAPDGSSKTPLLAQAVVSGSVFDRPFPGDDFAPYGEEAGR